MDVFLESTSGSISEHCRVEYQDLETPEESTLRRTKMKTGEIVNITCLRGKYETPRQMTNWVRASSTGTLERA